MLNETPHCTDPKSLIGSVYNTKPEIFTVFERIILNVPFDHINCPHLRLFSCTFAGRAEIGTSLRTGTNSSAGFQVTLESH